MTRCIWRNVTVCFMIELLYYIFTRECLAFFCFYKEMVSVKRGQFCVIIYFTPLIESTLLAYLHGQHQ